MRKAEISKEYFWLDSDVNVWHEKTQSFQRVAQNVSIADDVQKQSIIVSMKVWRCLSICETIDSYSSL